MDNEEATKAWRNFDTTWPIVACRMRRDDLKRLYTLINERQVEYGKIVLAALIQTHDETVEQFQQRRQRVSQAFVTTVSATGTDGEVVTGQGEDFLNSVNIPEQIRTVFYSTETGPTVTFPGFVPQSKATVLLDFSRRSLIDFTTVPTSPTKNASNFSVSSNSEVWFAALNSRLIKFFGDRKTSYNWLHQQGIYDLLLFVIIIPLALWIDHRLGSFEVLRNAPSIVASAIYVYAFFFVLYVYRMFFSYSRGVFPKVEIQSDCSSPFQHRTVWGTIVIGIIAAVLWME
jgi:hypothetical protein